MEPVEDEVVTEVIEIPTLFDESRTVVGTHKMTPEEAFAAFCRRRPGFLRRVADICYERQTLGQRPSTKSAWEVLRGQEDAVTGKRFELDNRWTSSCADRLAELYPDLNLERRKRRS